MKLILTSVAANVMNELLPHLEKSPQNLPVLFIPTAADPYVERSWMEDDRNKLQQLGFNVIDFNLKNKTISEVEGAFSNIGAIFVAGGNTFYLLEKIRQSGFDKVLKKFLDKGFPYIGSSAGSVILGPNIEPMYYLDDPTQAPALKDYQGLGLVDFITLPHYDESKYKQGYKELVKKYRQEYKLQPLDDNQAIIINEDKLESITVKQA